MEKGILKITPKSGYIKIKGGRVSLKKEMPHIGEGKEFHNEECEYEGNPATKVVILRTGEVFTVDQKALEARKAKEERKDREEKEAKLRDEIKEKQKRSTDSFVLNKTRTPSDTRKCIIDDSDNFYLKLNRFAYYDDSENKFKFYSGNRFKIESNFGNLFNSEKQLSERHLTSIKELYPRNNVASRVFKPDWRLIVGLGGASVYEVGMTLHHIYGIPYIPASSIKGVLRSWVIQSCYNNNEGEAIGDPTFCTIFGCPANIKIEKQTYQSYFGEARKGKVDFFDAFPISEPKIEPDVMNPHYSDWYSEKSAPVDTDNPIPIFFLTVKDTSFQFVMASKSIEINKEPLWKRQNLNQWLESALSEKGIGAKTAVGYGYMSSQS